MINDHILLPYAHPLRNSLMNQLFDQTGCTAWKFFGWEGQAWVNKLVAIAEELRHTHVR